MKRALWLMGFLIIALISGPQEAAALEVCNDPPCSPGCESSCTYTDCSGTGIQTLNKQELPVTISPPGEDCSGAPPITYKTLPFTHESNPPYKTLPAEVIDSYGTCKTNTINNDEPCPPPPPPPFP